MDPLGDMSRGLTAALESIDQAFQMIMNHPEEMFGNSELSKLLISYTWPVSGLAVFAALIGILFALTMGVRRARDFTMPLAVSAVIMSSSMVAFWTFSNTLLTDVTQPMAQATLAIGAEYLPANQTVRIYPDLGQGGLQIFGYLFYLVLEVVPFAFAVLVSLGQAIAPGLLALAIGFYAYGSVGKSFLIWSTAFWGTCYLVGLPLIALAYRVLQIVNMTIQDGWAKFIVQLLAVMVMGYLLYLGFTKVQKKTAKIVGNVKSHIRNRPKVDASGSKPMPVRAARQAQSRNTSPAGGSKTARIGASVSTAKSALKLGGLVLSRRPVAATKQLIGMRAKMASAAPSTPPRQPTVIPKPDKSRIGSGVTVKKASSKKIVVPKPDRSRIGSGTIVKKPAIPAANGQPKLPFRNSKHRWGGGLS